MTALGRFETIAYRSDWSEGVQEKVLGMARIYESDGESAGESSHAAADTNISACARPMKP